MNETGEAIKAIKEFHKVEIEPTHKKMWRPMLAWIFGVIVVFDFLIMPIFIEKFNERESNKVSVQLALQFKDPTAQIQALKTFAEKRTWSTLTLLGGVLFYVAFGSLLTAADATRGMEKKAHAVNGTVLK